jgi:hypothetical protein
MIMDKWKRITIYYHGNGDLQDILNYIQICLKGPEYDEYSIYKMQTSSGLPKSDYGVTIELTLGKNKHGRSESGNILHAI